ncbi:MAG: prolyl-tRNA synthetase associated domain-containing protein [Promethearchaeota archaeon]
MSISTYFRFLFFLSQITSTDYCMDKLLKNWLEKYNIQYNLHTHPAVFTVPEAKIHCGHIPGTHIKNLFLRNKKTDEYFLVTIPSEKRLDLKVFRKLIGAPKIRFASPEALLDILGLTPGAVSPLGLVNDTKHRAVFILEKELWDADTLCAHPNVNTATLQMKNKYFRKFVDATGTEFRLIELPYIEEI